MPYGQNWELGDIQRRRNERKKERDTNAVLMQQIICEGDRQWINYAGIGASIILAAAIILYWFISPFVGLFAAILAVGFHMHWCIRWIYQHVRIAQLNHIQDNLLTLELFDDLQEMLAKQGRITQHDVK